jgi:mannose-6-phosphate isomerase-like protein (cupin superfamily)
MLDFETTRLPVNRLRPAQDGSDVRLLLDVSDYGGMAHFEIGPGQTSRAIKHATVHEIWYFLAGRGEMWRRSQNTEQIVPVEPGVCITIPQGTEFQFRSYGYSPLTALGLTIPSWPKDSSKEVQMVEGKWEPTLLV